MTESPSLRAASPSGQNANTDATLYDFMHREYGIQGRWTSPGPPRCLHKHAAARIVKIGTPGPAAFNLADPQSLDRYAYVRNTPTSLTDPLGLQPCDAWNTTLLLPNGKPVQFIGTSSVCEDGNGGGALGGGDAYQPLQDVPEFKPGGTGPGLWPQTQVPAQKKGFFACASDAAESVSIAADLHKIPGLKSGAGGFIVNAAAGNPFSGLTDLVASFNTGEAGGHNVFYHMALAATAGPALGFARVLPKAADGTPWAISPVDVAFSGLLGEYATGVGEANLALSAITYTGAAAACLAGWTQ